jgi:hypothetical protein
MVTIKIGNSMQDAASLPDNWVAEQIARRRASNAPICLEVRIQTDRLFMRLGTSGCPEGGETRRPTHLEAEVFKLWHRHGLDQPDFASSRVRPFLSDLQRFL